MVLLGCKPRGRHTEQHDIFFGIADEVRALVPHIKAFWPEANGKIHLDAYREVNHVDGFAVKIIEAANENNAAKLNQLFFMNLGGYQKNVFEELHYKILTVAPDKEQAITNAKESEFFKRHFSPHIDDKYGVDVDDIFNIEEVLPQEMKEKYQLTLTPTNVNTEDEIVLGYMPIEKL